VSRLDANRSPDESQKPTGGPPPNYIPGTAQLTLPIVARDWIVVALSNFRCFPSGCAFELSARTSRPITPFDPRNRTKTNDPRDALDLTIDLPDGTTVGVQHGPAAEHLDAPLLTILGGGGSNHVRNIRYWLTPLPTAGSLRFTIDWPGADIHQQSIETQSAAIQTAAAASVHRWD
jgi:hypothetical protein